MALSFCGCKKDQSVDVPTPPETFQVRANFWHKTSIDKESYRDTYYAWKRFDYMFYRFVEYEKKEGVWEATGDLPAILITNQEIEESGFTKTNINQPDYEKAGSVLLTLTSKLPAGWEGIAEDFDNFDYLACLRIDTDPNEIKPLPNESPSFPEGILEGYSE